MILTEKIKNSLDASVLCWLASSSQENIPNVSPKEIFTHFQNEFILVANIASPNTVKNIKRNPNVCISVLDILVQKGFQLKGTAEIIDKEHIDFPKLHEPLYKMAGDKFPIASITKMKVESAKEILAPSYQFFPDSTSEESQIENAKKAYGFSE